MKNMLGKGRRQSKSAKSGVMSRRALETEVRKGSEKAVKRYRGVLERLAEYDRT